MAEASVYFLTILKAGSLRSACQYDQVLVGALLPAYRQLPSDCAHLAGRERKGGGSKEGKQVSSGVSSSYKNTSPIIAGTHL